MSADPNPDSDRPDVVPPASSGRPDPTSPRASRGRLRTVLLSVVGGGAALALAVTAVAVLAPTPPRDSGARAASASPDPRSSASTAASAAPTPLPSSAAEVTTVLDGFLAAGARAAADPATGTDEVDPVATGAMLAEIANDQQELAAFGWTRSGSPTIVSASVLSSDPTAAPPTVLVRACLDISGVVTRDSAGAPVPSDPTVTPRALTDFTLVGSGSQWLVSDRSYPDNPQC